MENEFFSKFFEDFLIHIWIKEEFSKLRDLEKRACSHISRTTIPSWNHSEVFFPVIADPGLAHIML